MSDAMKKAAKNCPACKGLTMKSCKKKPSKACHKCGHCIHKALKSDHKDKCNGKKMHKCVMKKVGAKLHKCHRKCKNGRCHHKCMKKFHGPIMACAKSSGCPAPTVAETIFLQHPAMSDAMKKAAKNCPACKGLTMKSCKKKPSKACHKCGHCIHKALKSDHKHKCNGKKMHKCVMKKVGAKLHKCHRKCKNGRCHHKCMKKFHGPIMACAKSSGCHAPH